YEVEDLIQEGYLCFCKVWDTYKHTFDVLNPSLEQRRNFMALVQVTFLNRIKNMVKHSKYEKAVHYTDDWSSRISPVDEVATLVILLRNAPAEIKDVLEKLVKDFEPVPYRRYKVRPGREYRVRETTRDYWARVLGVPDAKLLVTRYFGEPELH